ncbi:MAG: hypothetical protein IPL32_07675 [Chloracidobacterium sp.]|nr:hypothetical protein [Chloracidobacterium sp.]
MTNDAIEFNGKSFGLRVLDFGEDWGTCRVASHNLNQLLMDETGQYISREAQSVDEHIFYFIAPAEFRLSDEALTTKILREVQ